MTKEELRTMIENGENIENVDVTDITDMSYLFEGIDRFDQDLTSWDVSNVLTMEGMFDTTEFNQDISSWDVSNVNNMNSMFFHATSFNQPLNNWNVSNVRYERNVSVRHRLQSAIEQVGCVECS